MLKTPLKVVREATSERLLYHIADAEKTYLALDLNTREEAQEIVRDCNIHDKLVMVLSALVDELCGPDRESPQTQVELSLILEAKCILGEVDNAQNTA